MFQVQSQNIWMKDSSEDIGKDKKFSFKDELYIFLENTICHCYRHMAQVDRTVIERLMWFCIHVFGLSSWIFFTTTLFANFTRNPLITTLYDTVYPVKNIPFPAVTICSKNRISREQAEIYAKELSLKDPQGRSEFYFLRELIYLGRIYDFETENEHLVTAFQQFLDQTTDKNLANSTFESLIERLNPSCEKILLKCFFKSKEYKCMFEFQMIEQRKSALGFCCSFNYIKRNIDNPMNSPYYPTVTGPDMGLIVVVNNTSDDYFYNIFNSVGLAILIHNYNEYPDPGSGSALERFVSPGQEIFLRVDSVSITSERDILNYKAEKRQCLFSDENRQYGGKYTRSDCFLNCKIRSVKALCDCIPFSFPQENAHSESLKTCTLQHVPCLNKYKIKWSTIMSEMIDIDGLQREMEESLLCRECYPTCSDSKYRVTTSILPLVFNNRTGFGITNHIKNVSDISVIRVFLGQRETWQYKQDVAFYWFEIFSNIGGLCGVVGGYSLIGFTEMIYFVLKQFVLYVLRKSNINRKTEDFQIYP
ncbi:CLUMA_CG005264, isoform A [Clunio marinus]|uniref:CLUMA_CG005264, isoform A n=1 Tax=Clunio marinus TaxID=568069 RepID=A0A1J1HVM8_9DIPT|nr:CLUMA_CG005264, isoform A [Clunio marinus]